MPTGVGPRTIVPTASHRRPRSSSAPHAAGIRIGGPTSSRTTTGPGILEASGPPSVPSAICWIAGGSCRSVGTAAPHQHPGVVPSTTTAPNDLWTADFKGQFTTRDGIYCYPLTIADQHTRFLLTCHGLPSTHGAGARTIFERTFRTDGLPRAIRTDNGVPFATSGIHGLSQLNVWWMRLGIQHQRIHPGRPQQNGAHERMHRTLKRGAIRPPRTNAPAQQRAFNRFRTEYNTERPHQHLGGQTPSSRYHPSLRAYPRHLPAQEYPGHFLVKKITTGRTFRFQHRPLFIANSLTHHHIGFEETADGIWSIYLNTVLLAKLDERD